MKKDIRSAVRAVVINEKKKVLLIYDSENDFFQLPGGGVNENEEIRIAVLRETLEETGYEVSIIKILGEYVEDLGDLINKTIGFLVSENDKSKRRPEYDELGYRNIWKTIDEAILLIQIQVDNQEMKEYKTFNLREVHFLKLAKAHLELYKRISL